MSAIDLRRAAFATLLACYHNDFANCTDEHKHSLAYVHKVLKEAGAPVGALSLDPRLTSTDAGAIAVGIAKRVTTNEKASKSFIDVEIGEGMFLVSFDKEIKTEAAIGVVSPMGKIAQLCKPGDKIGEGLESDMTILAIEPAQQVAEGFVQEAKASLVEHGDFYHDPEVKSPEFHSNRVNHLKDLMASAPAEDKVKLKQYLDLENDRLARAKVKMAASSNTAHHDTDESVSEDASAQAPGAITRRALHVRSNHPNKAVAGRAVVAQRAGTSPGSVVVSPIGRNGTPEGEHEVHREDIVRLGEAIDPMSAIADIHPVTAMTYGFLQGMHGSKVEAERAAAEAALSTFSSGAPDWQSKFLGAAAVAIKAHHDATPHGVKMLNAISSVPTGASAPHYYDVVRNRFGGMKMPESVAGVEEADGDRAARLKRDLEATKARTTAILAGHAARMAAITGKKPATEGVIDALHTHVSELWTKHSEGEGADDKHPGSDWDKWHAFMADARKELGDEHKVGLDHVERESEVGGGPESAGEMTAMLLNHGAMREDKFKVGDRVHVGRASARATVTDVGDRAGSVIAAQDGSSKELAFHPDAVVKAADAKPTVVVKLPTFGGKLHPEVTDRLRSLPGFVHGNRHAIAPVASKEDAEAIVALAKSHGHEAHVNHQTESVAPHIGEATIIPAADVQVVFEAAYGAGAWGSLKEATRTQDALAYMMKAFALPVAGKVETGNADFDAVFRAAVGAAKGAPASLTEAAIEDLAFALHEKFGAVLPLIQATINENAVGEPGETDPARADVLRTVAGHLLLAEGAVKPEATQSLERLVAYIKRVTVDSTTA